jgi:hypothetical protein
MGRSVGRFEPAPCMSLVMADIVAKVGFDVALIGAAGF